MPNVRVRLIVEDEWEIDSTLSLENAKEEAEEMCKDIRRDHLCSCVVESVEIVR